MTDRAGGGQQSVEWHHVTRRLGCQGASLGWIFDALHRWTARGCQKTGCKRKMQRGVRIYAAAETPPKRRLSP